MSDGNKVLNNELNVKIDFNAMAAELKSLGISFNKSLINLKKKELNARCNLADVPTTDHVECSHEANVLHWLLTLAASKGYSGHKHPRGERGGVITYVPRHSTMLLCCIPGMQTSVYVTCLYYQ